MSHQKYEYKTFVSQVVLEEDASGPTFAAGLDGALNGLGDDGWDLKWVLPMDAALGFVFQRTAETERTGEVSF